MNERTTTNRTGLDLKLRRIRAGVRQYRVAQALGIPASLLCDYENGRRPVPPEQAAAIATTIRALGDERDRGTASQTR